VNILENLSAANNTTKFVGEYFYGRDTVNAQKDVGGIIAIPEDSNWVNSSLAFRTRLSDSTTEKARITSSGNFKLAGTATRATTEGTNHLDIFDGTAPVGTLANGISLYSTAGELRVMDAAGNATLLSPHDKNGFWIFDSVDSVTGKHLQIDMEKLLKAVNDKFGWDFVKEYVEEIH